MDIDGPYLGSARQALAGMDEDQIWSDVFRGMARFCKYKLGHGSNHDVVTSIAFVTSIEIIPSPTISPQKKPLFFKPLK